MRLIAKIKKITPPVKFRKTGVVRTVVNNYLRPLNSSHTNDADKWFDSIGLKHTNIKNHFIQKCVGPRCIFNPNVGGEVLNSEIAIRLFILMLFNEPKKVYSYAPQQYQIPQSMIRLKGKSDKIFVLVEEAMKEYEGDPHHSFEGVPKQPLNIKDLKDKYDPKGFFDNLYNYLRENIAAWSTDGLPQGADDEMKSKQNECFDKMKSELSPEESDQYIKDLKLNYLSELNRIIKFCKDNFNKNDIESKPNSFQLNLQKVTWGQTKSLMTDPEGTIRKYIAAKKWAAPFIANPGKNVCKSKVIKNLTDGSVTPGLIYSNEIVYNYLCSNRDTLENENTENNIFLKPEIFFNTVIIPDYSSNLDKIMNYIRGNERTDQISYRVDDSTYARLDIDTTVEVEEEGRIRRIYPKNSHFSTYQDGDIERSNGYMLGLAMFNMQQHRHGSRTTSTYTNNQGKEEKIFGPAYLKPTQDEIEKFVQNYDLQKMLTAANHFESLTSSSSWQKSRQKIVEKEEHPIALDFRKDSEKSSIGFYWTDLQTDKSEEEHLAMGHCGKDEGWGTLLSLRSLRPDPYNPGKYKRLGWLTASVNSNGWIRQLKSGENTQQIPEVCLEKIFELLTSDLNPQLVTIVKDKKVYPFTVQPLPIKTLRRYDGSQVDLAPYASPNKIQPVFENKSNPGFAQGTYYEKYDFRISWFPDPMLKDFYEKRPDFFAWPEEVKDKETEIIEQRLIKMYGK